EAAKLAEQIKALQQEMVQTARNAQNNEEALLRLEDELQNLNAEERQKMNTLIRDHDNLSQILAALLRLSRQPPQALLALPITPEEALQSAILLRAMIPHLQEEAGALKTELVGLAALREKMGARKSEVAVKIEDLNDEKAKLAGLVKQRQERHTLTEKERNEKASQIQQLASKAADLRDLLEKLEEERKMRAAQKAAKKPSAKQPPPEQVFGQLSLPAKGKILINYGETNELGAASKGVTLETRAGAQVISPANGTVAFVGPFRGYGLILIIEHGGGYHTLLSGLGRIDATLGQDLLAGEPVGAMNDEGGKPQRLYVEFRRQGQPTNPASLKSAGKLKKVDG
ncbi:MAG: murein hydrolase activator EnvC, partial [Dongiaceae bacterium]